VGKKAIIIGAGIGGLAAAIALRQAGWDVSVHEQAEALLPMGAGLSIWRNAVDALDQLGCGAALAQQTQPLERVALARSDGREFAGFATALIVPGAPARTATRTEIQAMLLAALGDASLRLGERLEAWEDHSGGVRVRFANGRTEQGDLLIAADGIRSPIAAAVIGDEPYHAGYGGVLAISDPLAEARTTGIEHCASGERLGVFGVSGGRSYWFYMCNERSPDAARALTLDHIRARMADWTEAAKAPIGATPPDHLIPFSIHAKPPPKRLGRGRILCVGDAAHAMEPNLGQGACQALEDAVAIGWVARDADAADILPRYEALRLKRVRSIVALARQGAILAHKLPAPLFGPASALMGGLSGLMAGQMRGMHQLPDYEAAVKRLARR
jgi:2-polyprenyl-6-methoxyphenol hydroxylase-like FAD-dependent oxidoreductase